MNSIGKVTIGRNHDSPYERPKKYTPPKLRHSES